jgi:hypothetical protein
VGDGLKRARKAAKTSRASKGRVYEIEGGAVVDGVGRIDLTIPIEDLGLYPIGAKVRVSIEK